MRTTLIALLLLFSGIEILAQAAGQTPLPADSVMNMLETQKQEIEQLNYSIWRQEQHLTNTSKDLSRFHQENQQVQKRLYESISGLNDSIDNVEESIDEQLAAQKKSIEVHAADIQNDLLWIFVGLIVVLLLVIIFGIMILRMVSRHRKSLEQNLEENKNETATLLEAKLRHLEENLGNTFSDKLRENSGIMRKDPELIYQPALELADEIQRLRNLMSDNPKSKQEKTYKLQVSDMLKKLKYQGYKVKSYNGKKVKRKYDLIIENTSADKMHIIGATIKKTVKPEVKFNGRIIQKAHVEIKNT